LFDQLKTKFPIRARMDVRWSADLGATASIASKSGIGGSWPGIANPLPLLGSARHLTYDDNSQRTETIGKFASAGMVAAAMV
jgi:hypothetical protein